MDTPFVRPFRAPTRGGHFLCPDSYKISQSSGKIGQLFGIVELFN